MEQVLHVYMTTNKHLYKLIDIVGDLNYPKKIRINREEFVGLQKTSISNISFEKAKLIRPRSNKRFNKFLKEFLGNDFIL